MERKLAAILAADIAGFSRHMEVDEEAALATLEGHRRTAEACVGEFAGRIFGTAGDSVIAEFPSAVQAVRCAQRLQEAIARRNAELAPAHRMSFRVAVNLGDVMIAEDNLYGDGVNAADRLQALAPPGGICVSESVYQQVHKVLPLSYRYLGRHTVKNISEPIHAYLVADTAGGRPAKWPSWRVPAVVAAALVVALAGLVWWRPWGTPSGSVPSRQDMGGMTKPQRHFAVDNPADLDRGDALTIYERIKDEMAAAYAKSDLDVAEAYQGWRKYNSAPYRSAQHGRRYVNNYANAKGKAYGDFEAIGEMPVGGAVAKDSFEVTERGDVFTGPLFVMREMSAGFNETTGDWRYTMIRSDGEVFGRTNGPNGDRVAFCADCHAHAAERSDYLFFLPEDLRRTPLSPKD